jgi:ABC-type transport system involved in multi-copper enzyme maturation permease subunit
VGPLFYYELVRLARKGRSTLLRCAYALALLAALAYEYHDAFPEQPLFDLTFGRDASVPAGRLADLGRRFALVVLVVQYAAVLVLTPAFVAGAFAGERERGTLDLLLATPLRSREIVLGKLFARLVHVGVLLLTGLPVLCIVLVWGGVAPSDILSWAVATGLCLLTVGSLCAAFSSGATRAAEPLFVGYALSFLSCACCPVFVMGATGPASLGPRRVPVYVAATVLASLVAAGVAVKGLRDAGPAPRAAGRDLRRAARRSKRPPAPPRPPGPLPPVGYWPLLWKEYFFPAAGGARREARTGPRLTAALLLLPALAGGAGLRALSHLTGGRDFRSEREFAGELARWLLAVAAGVWCVTTAFRAAGSVSGERERRTLDPLLTLPSPRSAWLGAKWLGAALRGATEARWLVAAAAAGVLGGALHPAAPLLVGVSLAAWLAFWASLGVWLSVACRTTLLARVAVAAVLLLAFGGGWLYLMSEPSFSSRRGFVVQYGSGADGVVPAAVADVGLNPLRAWWFLALPWHEAGETSEVRMAATAVGTLMVAALAGALWLDARRRFERYESH